MIHEYCTYDTSLGCTLSLSICVNLYFLIADKDRLHDLRCANTIVSTFNDPANSDATYSLLPIGREKIIAGCSKHALIKVLDLRLAGGKSYASTLLQPHYSRETYKGCWTNGKWHPDQVWEPSTLDETPPPHLGPTRRLRHPHVMASQDWSVFLALSPNARNPRGSFESPVYSLSRPSSTAPTFYAGAEQNIFQIDLLSLLDEHPDPFFQNGPIPTTSPTPSSAFPSPLRAAWDVHTNAFAVPRGQNPHKLQRSTLSSSDHASRYRRRCVDRFVSWKLHPDEILDEPMINQFSESIGLSQMWYQQSAGEAVQRMGEEIATAAAETSSPEATSTGTKRRVLDERWEQVKYR